MLENAVGGLLHALSTQEQDLFGPANTVDLSHLPVALSCVGLDPSVFLTPSRLLEQSEFMCFG